MWLGMDPMPIPGARSEVTSCVNSHPRLEEGLVLQRNAGIWVAEEKTLGRKKEVPTLKVEEFNQKRGLDLFKVYKSMRWLFIRFT